MSFFCWWTFFVLTLQQKDSPATRRTTTWKTESDFNLKHSLCSFVKFNSQVDNDICRSVRILSLDWNLSNGSRLQLVEKSRIGMQTFVFVNDPSYGRFFFQIFFFCISSSSFLFYTWFLFFFWGSLEIEKSAFFLQLTSSRCPLGLAIVWTWLSHGLLQFCGSFDVRKSHSLTVLIRRHCWTYENGSRLSRTLS